MRSFGTFNRNFEKKMSNSAYDRTALTAMDIRLRTVT